MAIPGSAPNTVQGLQVRAFFWPLCALLLSYQENALTGRQPSLGPPLQHCQVMVKIQHLHREPLALFLTWTLGQTLDQAGIKMKRERMLLDIASKKTSAQGTNRPRGIFPAPVFREQDQSHRKSQQTRTWQILGLRERACSSLLTSAFPCSIAPSRAYNHGAGSRGGRVVRSSHTASSSRA